MNIQLEKEKKVGGESGESCPKKKKVSYRNDYIEDFIKNGAKNATFATLPFVCIYPNTLLNY